MIFHFFLRIHDCFFITSNNILLSISIYVELIYSSIINWQNLSILLSNTHYLKIQFELVFYMGAYGLIFVLSMCVYCSSFYFFWYRYFSVGGANVFFLRQQYKKLLRGSYHSLFFTPCI